jgi:radical S-adenosyl methionine domain-containing protein 2
VLLAELYCFFAPGNAGNPLRGMMRWKNVRLNLAGGEPLLHYRRLPDVIRRARALGFEVSLITNASRLTGEVVAALAPKLTWLGISIDSASARTNRAIGRTDRQGNLLGVEALAEALDAARAAHPQLKLKLNTVVNKLNEAEDLSPVITRLAPDKWKVLRMLPMVTDALTVSDEEFNGFVARQQQFAPILCAEDNHEMRDSYLMVDPDGRFFQNGEREMGQGYIYSPPILEVGAAKAFGAISFDPSRFCARYPQSVAGDAN